MYMCVITILFNIKSTHSRPYTAKLSCGKTFAVVHKIHHSLENFHGASGCAHHVLYTASDSRGKLSRSTEKRTHSKVLPYTVKLWKRFPLESFDVCAYKFSKYVNSTI